MNKSTAIGILSLILFSLIGPRPALAQPAVSGVMVSAETLKKHVYLLASDSLQGRLTGTAGQLQAAYYCMALFRRYRFGRVFRQDSTRITYRQTYPFTITETARFGSVATSPSFPKPYHRFGSITASSSTYKHYELATIPRTTKDSGRVLFGDNVAGLLVGTDLKQQVVVLSAHYDHLGSEGKRVYHGADDNASGTATVLGVAAVFDSLAQQGIRSRRSILFVLFSGEEGGLLGSKYFVANSPLPLQQIVCDLNVDMVGRVDDDHRKKPDYCYLITDGESRGKDLLKLAETANQQSVGLVINQGGYDVANDPEQHFYRSDQFTFAKVGIPALFFTNGSHPDYHRITDTADRIRYDVLQKRATLVFQTAWSVANPVP